MSEETQLWYRLERVSREADVLEGAVEYWRQTALAHRNLLRQILAESPHQHVKTEISTHLRKYEGDTDE